ncbi:beta and beta-prime subunits of dna dependent rna-polymerase [Phaffia rhodozyma]|uniref:DNA-directed RNA polymerase subunit n=1 Tax=Phaffia rhodozyma TaxID=264483 RepID=A0A0F7SHN3_PHARH|nr:beta and beta-prime subunits of dna dependent rna-polymerase [Phaffia rhodozyma]
MDISRSLPSTPQSISFSFLSTEDIQRISVKQIVNPILFDNLSRPTIGGLYDPALGPMEKGDVCSTCRLTSFDCPGHFGHITLSTPVYHPLFFTQCYNLIRQTCMFCHKLRNPAAEISRFVGRLTLLDHGLLSEAIQLGNMHAVVVAPNEKGKSTADDSESEDGEQGKVSETEPMFIKRVEEFVRASLATVKAPSSGNKRDAYKDDLVYNERKKLISEFSKRGYKKCHSCKAFAHTYRKEGSTKIIEYELGAKNDAIHAATGKVRPNVLQIERYIANRKSGAIIHDDAGYQVGPSTGKGAGSDSESEAEEANEDIEMEDEEAQLERAKEAGSKKRKERVMSSEEARAHLRMLFKNEPLITSLIYGGHGPFTKKTVTSTAPSAKLIPAYKALPPASADMFFMSLVPVPPTRFRPASKMGDLTFENSQNDYLNKILQTSYRIRDLTAQLTAGTSKPKAGETVGLLMDLEERTRVYGLLLGALVQLQIDVNSFIDSSKNPTIIRGGGPPPNGVKQVLEKKEGLFRKHMMGKRVNYAARSVISPDINLETNEIGVPPVFAIKLTFPEPVTIHNINQMRQAVINGPSTYPGASMIVNEDGTRIALDRMTLEQRTALANQLLTPQEGSYSLAQGGLSTRTQVINKKVFRHLRDGDILLLNRQPTLHKPSMMAHKARVLLGEKTIRMHYANCNSYNADFDGDEMNIHFAQSQTARAEAYNIANTDNQYLVPTSGQPLRGLIQDHVVAGTWMCSKGSFFTREQYHQLLYGALRTEEDYCSSGKIVTVPPTIWKPQPLWTGKQLITTLLLNIKPLNAKGLNLESKNKVKNELWGPHSKDNDVLFMDGELLIGILDKSQFGASSYGLVHSCFEVYGAETAGKVLSVLSRLFTKYLQHDAFSCRMDDLVLTAAGENERKELLSQIDADGKKVAISYVGLGEDADPEDPDVKHNLQIRLEEILRDDRLMAGLDNVMQARFGQTTTKVNATLNPHRLVKPFPHNNMQMMTVSGAKGSATNATMISSVLGQQSLEGRRVPTMVSGKTLPSFKPFETAARAGGYVANRFLTGIRPQEYYFHCMSGREGLIDTAVKTSRSGYLQRCLIKHLEGIRVHYDHTVRDSDSSVIQFHYGEDSLDVTKQAHLDPKQFAFNIANSESLLQRYDAAALNGRMDEETAVAHMKKAARKPRKYDPALSIYSPSLYFGSTGEKYAASVDEYIEKNPNNLIITKAKKGAEASKQSPWAIQKQKFKGMMNLRYIKAMIDPGEAVGLLAAQGVGEPSTQMTLNTFHLAGHGAANVTLGIPRLRELVMTASSKPKTPSMKLPIYDAVRDDDLNMFIKNTKKVTLSELVEKVTVTERLTNKTQSNGYSRSREYTVLLDLFPKEEYLEEHDLTPNQILEALPTSFAPHVRNEILRELKDVSKMMKNDLEGVGKGSAVRIPKGAVDENLDTSVEDKGEDAGDDAESDIGDGDADDVKRASKSKEMTSYEDDDESGSEPDLDDIEGAFPADEDEGEAAAAAAAENHAAMSARYEEIQTQFITVAKYVSSFSFDRKEGRSCEFQISFPGDSQKLLIVDVMERCCRKAVIHQVPDISRAIRLRTGSGDDEAWEHGKRTLLTEGSNFQAMWEHANELVDLNYIRSNDIAAILHTYGVEAARASIIREVSGVFGVYAITINFRHLSLIADYMTHEGGYKPFNRTGISSKSSPLLKASFETTMAFLSEATLHGDFDDLKSPSANIVMGKPSVNGTAVFDILTPVDAFVQAEA